MNENREMSNVSHSAALQGDKGFIEAVKARRETSSCNCADMSWESSIWLVNEILKQATSIKEWVNTVPAMSVIKDACKSS